MKLIDHLCTLRNAASGEFMFVFKSIVIKPHVFDIVFKRKGEDANLLHLQFTSRIYSSVGELLLGYDLDCCRFLLGPGKTIYTTPSTYILLRYNVCILTHKVVEYRIQKWSKRGFDFFSPKGILAYRNEQNGMQGVSIHNTGYNSGPPLLTYSRDSRPLKEDQLLYLHTLMAVSIARSSEVCSFVNSIPNGVMQYIN